MTQPFLEERLPVSIKMGATYADEYAVQITKTSSGSESRRLIHPYPTCYYNIGYVGKTTDLWAAIVGLYHRAYGMYAGFRVRAMDDFSTNANTSAPTALDQTATLVSSGIYQLQKLYGAGGTPLSIGLPSRTIFKPVSGTVLMGLSGVSIPAAGFTVDTTTGKVTFAANKTRNISNITKAARAVVTVGSHTFTTDDTVYVSAVSGMTQINSARYSIYSTDATSITLNVNSTAFSNYATGGVVNTFPQTGEAVTCGCEFDIPFRFNSRIDISHEAVDVRDIDNVEIVELITL